MFSPSRQNRPQPQSTLARPLRRVPRPVARITARITARMTARIAAALGLVWLAGCDPVSLGGPVGATGPAINPNAPVSVALLVPRGSGNAGDDALADSLEKAARLAVAGLDGVQIDLRVYGTAAQPARAQEVALQAVAEGAKIILGPVYAENANAVAVAVAPKGGNFFFEIPRNHPKSLALWSVSLPQFSWCKTLFLQVEPLCHGPHCPRY